MHCILKGLKVKKGFCYKETVMKWVSAVLLLGAVCSSSGTTDWWHCMYLYFMLQQPLIVLGGFCVSFSQYIPPALASPWSSLNDLHLLSCYISLVQFYTGCTFRVQSPSCSAKQSSEAPLLHARMMTYFLTSGDNILYCIQPCKIPPSLSTLHVNGF